MRHELGSRTSCGRPTSRTPATTWPYSQSYIERNFAGVPADETEFMVCGNAARVYGL